MKFLFLCLLISISFTSVSQAKVSPAYDSSGGPFVLETLLKENDVIWGFDFIDNDQIIYTKRGGELKIYTLSNKKSSKALALPQVSPKGQGGLLDVRVHPKNKNKIFLTYSEPISPTTATTALATGDLYGLELKNIKKLFSANAIHSSRIHYGSRIEFDNHNHIYLTVGDRDQRDRSQDLSYHNGKIIRLNLDGTIPSDNPFIKNPKARHEVWTLGHRNPQGLTRHPTTGQLWASEMGPRGGDELNLIKPGTNYGWPIVTYGREYYGPKIGEGTSKEGLEQPVAYWVPSLSPSAITFYTGTLFSKWHHHLFIAALSGQHLRRLKIENEKVIEQEELLKNFNHRIRNVRTGPDGALYFSTDSGLLVRILPK